MAKVIVAPGTLIHRNYVWKRSRIVFHQDLPLAVLKTAHGHTRNGWQTTHLECSCHPGWKVKMRMRVKVVSPKSKANGADWQAAAKRIHAEAHGVAVHDCGDARLVVLR